MLQVHEVDAVVDKDRFCREQTLNRLDVLAGNDITNKAGGAWPGMTSAYGNLV